MKKAGFNPGWTGHLILHPSTIFVCCAAMDVLPFQNVFVELLRTKVFHVFMAGLVSIARQVVRGLPYLRKELERKLSLKTGRVFTTPITYYVIFGGRCNLACTFCTIRKYREPELSEEVMLRIVQEAKELSGKGFNISLSGGEPTIYRPLYRALELAQKLKVNFGFTTNGLTLTEGNVRRILNCDPFNINISLESVDPKINESLRTSADGTRRALRGIDNVLAEKERIGSRVSVIIKPTIMEQNYRALSDLVRHFGRHSKVQINFQPFVGAKDDPHWVRDTTILSHVLDELLDLQKQGYPIMGDKQTFDGFFRYFNNLSESKDIRHLDLKGQRRNCDIGLRSMFIYANGDVHFCDFLNQSVGNVHRESLSQIYYNVIARRQRKRMAYCDIDCQQTCKRPTPLRVKVRSFLRMG